MYVVEKSIKPTREVLPITMFSWLPQTGDSFDMIVEADEKGQRFLSRIICTNLTEQEALDRNERLTKLHDLEREWTIQEIDDYIDHVMSEIFEEVRSKRTSE
jgi:hypothetical protein